MEHLMTPPQVLTFGCRLNRAESDVIMANALKQGVKNVIVVNTCAVTTEAERQAKQAIRRAKRENPQAFIIATGCAVQIAPKVFKEMPEVDRLLGNHEKMDALSFSPAHNRQQRVDDIHQIEEVSPHPTHAFAGQVRTFVPIQNGCDHSCTFCIIPAGRGKSRSVPLGRLVQDIRALLAQGTQEIVLTGVDITAYGADLPVPLSLGGMLKRLLTALPELKRLRLSSLDPAECEDDFFEALQDQRLLPHFHISLQAGDDLILRRMRRRHLRQDVMDFCAKIRSLRPDAVFGADVIAGFPTETDQHFENTYQLLESCRIPLLHVFPFSPRPKTPAARMPQVNPQVIKKRAAILRELGDRLKQTLFESVVGETVSALIEKPDFAHSDRFLPLHLEKPGTSGSTCQIHITRLQEKKLWGIPL